jgi:peptidoglycan/LPS O-acetylase OafA/YrhL
MYLNQYSLGRDNNFNLLRFVAASLVLVSHSFALSTGSPMAEPLRGALGLTWGIIAVHIFFVTSGFLVTASLISRKSLTSFAAARILRIYPGLWVALIVTVLVAGTCITTLSAADFFRNTETWKYLLNNGSILRQSYRWILPGVFENIPYRNAVNGSLWTLPAEVKMYISLALVWLISRRLSGDAMQNFLRICLAFAVVGMVWNLAAIIIDVLPSKYDTFWYVGYMFFLGVALRLLQNRVPMSYRLASLMFLAILIATFNKMTFGIVYSLCIAYLVMFLAFVPKGKIRNFNRFGDYSYGIYIYAFPVQQSIAHFWKGVSPYEMMASSFCVTLLLAIASWELVEKKALTFKGLFERVSIKPKDITVKWSA